MKLRTIIILFSLSFVSMSVQSQSKIPWGTKQVEYEGYPLLLRKPDHSNIWGYQEKFTKLVCLSHSLDSVSSDGLPLREYNLSLREFDNQLTELLENSDDGIIVLVETFGGYRHYWFYISATVNETDLFKEILKENSDKELELTGKFDKDWEFLNDYPYQLYEKK